MSKIDMVETLTMMQDTAETAQKNATRDNTVRENVEQQQQQKRNCSCNVVYKLNNVAELHVDTNN